MTRTQPLTEIDSTDGYTNALLERGFEEQFVYALRALRQQYIPQGINCGIMARSATWAPLCFLSYKYHRVNRDGTVTPCSVSSDYIEYKDIAARCREAVHLIDQGKVALERIASSPKPQMY